MKLTKRIAKLKTELGDQADPANRQVDPAKAVQLGWTETRMAIMKYYVERFTLLARLEKMRKAKYRK